MGPLNNIDKVKSNQGKRWELTVSTDAHNHEKIVTDDSNPLIRNKIVDVTTQATGLLRATRVSLAAQRRSLAISTTVEEEEGIVGWLLKNEVDEESKDIEHENENPKRIEVEAELPIHPGSDPVNSVGVGASLKDVDGETDLTKEEEWLE